MEIDITLKPCTKLGTLECLVDSNSKVYKYSIHCKCFSGLIKRSCIGPSSATEEEAKDIWNQCNVDYQI